MFFEKIAQCRKSKYCFLIRTNVQKSTEGPCELFWQISELLWSPTKSHKFTFYFHEEPTKNENQTNPSAKTLGCTGSFGNSIWHELRVRHIILSDFCHDVDRNVVFVIGLQVVKEVHVSQQFLTGTPIVQNFATTSRGIVDLVWLQVSHHANSFHDQFYSSRGVFHGLHNGDISWL